MPYIDVLKKIGVDLIKADVAEQEVTAVEADFQKAGAEIVSKFEQENGLFTVYGIKPDSRVASSFSTSNTYTSRQTVDKAMTSGR